MNDRPNGERCFQMLRQDLLEGPVPIHDKEHKRARGSQAVLKRLPGSLAHPSLGMKGPSPSVICLAPAFFPERQP